MEKYFSVVYKAPRLWYFIMTVQTDRDKDKTNLERNPKSRARKALYGRLRSMEYILEAIVIQFQKIEKSLFIYNHTWEPNYKTEKESLYFM